MKNHPQSELANYLKGVPVTQIFIAAFVTQFCMGFEVLFRLNAASSIKHDFFDATNVLTSGAMIGEVLGVLFLGFAIANLVMSPFVDAIGLRRVHILSLLLYLVGTATIVTAVPGTDQAYLLLWGGSLLQGLAWGSIEAVLNPLVVTIYPTRKVPKLNLFHAAFALGMLLAAPACVMVEKLALGWRIQLGLVFIPAVIALLLIARVKYPPSERVVHGVSFKGMFQQTFARPAFYLFLCAMFISAATELVPASWIDLTLTRIVGIQGFWLVAFIYTVHIVVRLFTGVLYRLLGSSGILFFGSLFALAGLFLLSQAASPSAGMFAALLFGIGTSVMWPTMLASTSERFPGGGSLAIGVTASAGMSSTYVLMPLFGKLFDQAKISSAGGEAAFEALNEGSAALDQVLVSATTSIFQTATFLPSVLVVFFALAWLYDRKRNNALPPASKVLSPQV
ncbi:sugar MFS transporter [Pseudomonas sp. R5(2019)]|uniref:MFS transporter n=1 Tax=Pseudomonas sp. R5(2019) TaxID=2697566 RepID=UPI001411B654|nr:MFS transporter [Pseudomonas sp. R5(2019)]NBA97576.1 MFS transporter [Pseudomonas sp. R5(2019)]